MGNFFRDNYDLYKFVVEDASRAIGALREAVLAGTGEDMEQDIKDSCVTISEHGHFDPALDEVDIFFRLLDDKIGITPGVIK